MMSDVEHGRVHSDYKWPDKPKCLCGAEGVKDPMWDRFYCPVDGVWLEGLWAQCWCKACKAAADILNG